MDNQHRKIKGYRELKQNEIDAMNRVKEKAEEVGDLIRSLEEVGVDERWLDIGRDDLQKGFMALTRSIARPDFF